MPVPFLIKLYRNTIWGNFTSILRGEWVKMASIWSRFAPEMIWRDNCVTYLFYWHLWRFLAVLILKYFYIFIYYPPPHNILPLIKYCRLSRSSRRNRCIKITTQLVLYLGNGCHGAGIFIANTH